MILVLGGTHETKTVCSILNELGHPHILSVATELGATLYGEFATKCIVTRFDAPLLKKFISENQVTLIIDATHPHAVIVSETAKEAAKDRQIHYIAYQRTVDLTHDMETFECMAEAIDHLKQIESPNTKVLITGVKHAHEWASKFDPEKLVFRIMPSLESLNICLNAGIPVDNIIAVKAPCSIEFNQVLFKDYGISHFVFKNSGSGSAFENNLKSVEDINVTPIVIQANQTTSTNLINTAETLKLKLIEMEGLL